MDAISKITVKHFLNTSLGSKEGITGYYDDKGVLQTYAPRYPLYIKIIFMRKTTQMKSSVAGYSDYETLEEAGKKLGDLLNSEVGMLEDVIASEYKRLGDAFELKGITSKLAVYENGVREVIFEQYLWVNFFKVVARSKSEYARLLLSRFPKTPAISHYHAALKLLDPHPELLKLKERFENYEIIEDCLYKSRGKEPVTLFEWIYGKHKDIFSYTALKQGISFNKVSQLVGLIDGVLAKYIAQ